MFSREGNVVFADKLLCKPGIAREEVGRFVSAHLVLLNSQTWITVHTPGL